MVYQSRRLDSELNMNQKSDDLLDNRKGISHFDPCKTPSLRSYMLPIEANVSLMSFSTWCSHDQQNMRKRNFHTWQLANYADLRERDDGYCQSITFYCLPNSVTGVLVCYRMLESGKQSRVMFGVRKAGSVAMHLELRRDERVNDIYTGLEVDRSEGNWLHIRCPPLLVSCPTAFSLYGTNML